MAKPITVLFPITDLSMDGAQRQLLELVKGIDKDKFKPTVLTIHPGGSQEQTFREVPGLNVITLEHKRKNDLFLVFKILKVLRNVKPDIVQPFLTPATFYSLLTALLCHIPVRIVTERCSAGRRGTPLGYNLYLKAEDFLSRFTDWAIPNSEAGKDYLIERGINPDKIRVIYNGINLDRLVAREEDISRVKDGLRIPPGGSVVGILARLFPQKDHTTFLRAAAIVDQIIPDTRFALVGDGPLRSPLEKLSQELGLTSKTTFFGEQQNVGVYLSTFDIAVSTSEAEGCSNSILEAMALGKPVVATDVGGNQEIVSHGATGFLVPKGDHQAVAEAIIKILRDPKLAQSMSVKSKEIATSKFSINSMVQQYQILYQETLAAKQGNKGQGGRP